MFLFLAQKYAWLRDGWVHKASQLIISNPSGQRLSDLATVHPYILAVLMQASHAHISLRHAMADTPLPCSMATACTKHHIQNGCRAEWRKAWAVKVKPYLNSSTMITPLKDMVYPFMSGYTFQTMNSECLMLSNATLKHRVWEDDSLFAITSDEIIRFLGGAEPREDYLRIVEE